MRIQKKMEDTPDETMPFGLLDLIPNGIVIIQPDYSISFWNACMAEWTGISAEEAKGTNLIERYPALTKPSVFDRITQLFEGGPAVLFSSSFHPHLVPCSFPNGGLRVEKISFIPLHHNNRMYALVLIEDVSDLTNQVKAYRDMKNVADNQLNDLKKARDAIYLANKKLNLLSSLTRHDINNQLTILIGYIELIRDTEGLDPTVRDYLDLEYQAAETIMNQIQFTRFYQDIGIKTAMWQDVTETIRAAVKPLALKGIDLTIDLPPLEVYADPLLQRVFYNLVENSIRHGERLSNVRFSSVEDDNGLSIIYEDDGVGVPYEVKEKIFRREFFKHTGFGLFLSSEILSITHISIRESGVPGTGARFEMLVPMGTWRMEEKST